ncbi:hypothetical protein BDV96DRAFT_595464 [Lophiotrema nucula]|uniref:Uncharacterized protein n=1 Tax=Lophiotrema nucula TaxID=690887 RepID=A0A6A5ZLV8_9PLEO|nr:hypothetical protein BDV96DRAFT_595464 [Lophiotrema nucula]
MANVAGPSSGAGTPQGSPAAPGHLTRINTGSSDSSSLYAPLPPGRYTLPIHGSCPRCHHLHQAATVKIRVSASSNKKNKVNCERCGASWLALGGGNSTTISLLSQESADPDPIEVNVRNALINMVRSATFIASPTALADVPESLSRVQSHAPSVHSPMDSPVVEKHQSHSAEPKSTPPPSFDAKLALPIDEEATAANSPNGSTRFASHPVKGENKTKRLATQLKKLRERFPFLRSFRFGGWKLGRKSKMSEKQRGKLPIIRTLGSLSKIPDDSGSHVATSVPNIGGVLGPDEEAPETRRYEDQTAKAASVAQLDHTFDFNITKEELKQMSREDRIEWVRKQFSALKPKCNCSDDCDCRHSSTSAVSTSDDDGNTLPQLNPTRASIITLPTHPVGRRRSINEFFIGTLGIGARFDSQSVGPVEYAQSVASTNTSQAATLWEGMTATSGPSPMYLGVVHHHRHRSPSPRPRSVPPGSPIFPRHGRAHMDQDGVDRRWSGDSFTAVGSVAGIGRQGMDTRSIASPQRTLTAGPHRPPSSLVHFQLPPRDSADGDASHESAPRINDHRTSNESNRDATESIP